MLPLKEYFTKKGWKKDLEETLDRGYIKRGLKALVISFPLLTFNLDSVYSKDNCFEKIEDKKIEDYITIPFEENEKKFEVKADSTSKLENSIAELMKKYKTSDSLWFKIALPDSSDVSKERMQRVIKYIYLLDENNIIKPKGIRFIPSQDKNKVIIGIIYFPKK